MILESRKRWWHAIMPPSEATHSTSWATQRKCQRTLTTPSNEHVCEIVGEHYQHVCVDPECGFRWAA